MGRNRLPGASKKGDGALASAVEDDFVVIIDACRHDDKAAQRRLYDETHQSVYRLAVRMVGLQDAADVTQQTFLQVFRKIGQFSGKSQITTWIYRVTVNEALQHLRKRKRRHTHELKQEPMDRTSHRDANIDQKEMLERALGLLDPELRSAFLLKEVEGLSYAEIADALEIPAGTVGSRLNRARRELKERLTELGWRP